MVMKKLILRPLCLAVFVLTASWLLPTAGAYVRVQGGEHLTPEEVEFVRDAQELDRRTAVFIRAAERRILALSDPNSKQLDKDREKWGELKGSRARLLYEIGKILDEAVVNIDDAAARNPKSPLLKKSLNSLAAATERFIPQLAAMRDGAGVKRERETLEEAMEVAQEIVEAARRHASAPDPVPEKSDKKKSGKN